MKYIFSSIFNIDGALKIGFVNGELNEEMWISRFKGCKSRVTHK